MRQQLRKATAWFFVDTLLSEEEEFAHTPGDFALTSNKVRGGWSP